MLDDMSRREGARFQEPRRRPIPTPRTSVIKQQQVPKVVPRSVSIKGGSQIPPPPLLSRSEISRVVCPRHRLIWQVITKTKTLTVQSTQMAFASKIYFICGIP